MGGSTRHCCVPSVNDTARSWRESPVEATHLDTVLAFQIPCSALKHKALRLARQNVVLPLDCRTAAAWHCSESRLPKCGETQTTCCMMMATTSDGEEGSREVKLLPCLLARRVHTICDGVLIGVGLEG